MGKNEKCFFFPYVYDCDDELETIERFVGPVSESIFTNSFRTLIQMYVPAFVVQMRNEYIRKIV